MSQKIIDRTDADLYALLADPAPAPAAHEHRLTIKAVRLWLAAADAGQVVILGGVTQRFFPATATASSPAAVAALGVVVAVLAAVVRFALRAAAEPGAASVGTTAALRAAAAVAASLLATGAACWLALSQTDELPADLHQWIGAWLAASAAAAAALRLAAGPLVRSLTVGRRVIVVGAPEQAEPLAQSLAQAPHEAWQVVGRIDDAEPGGLDRLVALIEHAEADLVALAITGADAAARIANVCDRVSDHPVRVSLAFNATSLAHLPRALICVGRFALVDLVTDPHGGLAGVAKRGMDVVLAGLLLFALAPALALTALAIRLESPGPVLFRQWRFGLGSRPILVFKFRTMRTECCDADGTQRTAARDPRVTSFGRFLRRTSIDELPQLVNVLRGDMSLVGPRPHPLRMRVGGAYYFEAVESYRARHMVKPGITGWAQVNGSRGEVDTLEKARRRVALDLWYLDNWSLTLDLRILLRTAFGKFASFGAD